MTDWLDINGRIMVDRNIVYGAADGVDLLLDVFRPDTGDVLPGMLSIVGGGWMTAHKLNMDHFSLILASWGYVTANVTYRCAPEHKWPSCMDDVEAALAWLRGNSVAYGVDPRRIGAIGTSAGGHLAALLAVAMKKINAAVCLCTPVDLTVIHDVHEEGGGMTHLLPGSPEDTPDVYRETSPRRHVSAESPPVFFVHGEDDDIVPIADARLMSEQLRDAGVDSPFVAMPGVDHGVPGAVLAAGDESPMIQIRDFLARHLA